MFLAWVVFISGSVDSLHPLTGVLLHPVCVFDNKLNCECRAGFEFLFQLIRFHTCKHEYVYYSGFTGEVCGQSALSGAFSTLSRVEVSVETQLSSGMKKDSFKNIE